MRLRAALLLGGWLATSAAAKQACAVSNEGEEVVLDCGGLLISSIPFASYGTPSGSCAGDSGGQPFAKAASCHAAATQATLEDRCLGQATCIFTVTAAAFGDPLRCSGSGGDELGGPRRKWLAAVAACGDSMPTDAAAAASPPKPGLSIAWQSLLLLLAVFAVYCALGVLHKTRNEGAKGLEAVPHLETWKDLPYLVRDGVIYSVDSIKSKAQSEYDAVL